jgi:hypothetical protein
VKNIPITTSADEAREIGAEGFFYFYPLVLMDITRLQMTNIEPGKKPGCGPMNMFHHIPTFPPADMRVVVRPNFDTLYSVAWLDLTTEPVILSAPDTGGRYYLLPLLDMWTDVFASPGKRTSGTSAQNFAVVPQGWKGALPDGIDVIQAPTAYAWVIGRTQTNGPSDYEAVRKVQAGYTITPLSRWGKAPAPIVFKADPSVDMKTEPMFQVANMAAKKFFSYAAELLKLHPPHVTDWSMLARLARIGIEPGKSFAWDKLSSAVQNALTSATADGLEEMRTQATRLARAQNGWQTMTDTVGVYGNSYLHRAAVALAGLGANQPEDAIYPLSIADADGKPLLAENNYVLHLNKSEIPPVDAFWSLTLYDADGYQVANPLNRFALGDRDPLKFNADGSLDLFVQHESPGADIEANWLPAPASGAIGFVLRLYAPKATVRDGTWAPPAVRCVKRKGEVRAA